VALSNFMVDFILTSVLFYPLIISPNFFGDLLFYSLKLSF